EMTAPTLAPCWTTDERSLYDPILFIARSRKTTVSPPSVQTTRVEPCAMVRAKNDLALIVRRGLARGRPSPVQSAAAPKTRTGRGLLGGASSRARSLVDSRKTIFTNALLRWQSGQRSGSGVAGRMASAARRGLPQCMQYAARASGREGVDPPH